MMQPQVLWNKGGEHMSNTDFQNGFVVGFSAKGVPEININATEEINDESTHDEIPTANMAAKAIPKRREITFITTPSFCFSALYPIFLAGK